MNDSYVKESFAKMTRDFLNPNPFERIPPVTEDYRVSSCTEKLQILLDANPQMAFEALAEAIDFASLICEDHRKKITRADVLVRALCNVIKPTHDVETVKGPG